MFLNDNDWGKMSTTLAPWFSVSFILRSDRNFGRRTDTSDTRVNITVSTDRPMDDVLTSEEDHRGEMGPL